MRVRVLRRCKPRSFEGIAIKAIVYKGPRDVQVMDMPDPEIEHPNDVIVQKMKRLAVEAKQHRHLEAAA